MRNFLDNILTILKVFYLSTFRGISWVTKFSLKNKLLILGNGPSIKKSLDSIIESKDEFEVLAVNKFAISDEFHLIKPRFYFLLDGDFFQFDESIFNDAAKHPRVKKKPEFQAVQDEINKTWFSLLNCSWDLTLFVPQIYQDSFLINKARDAGLNVRVYNYTVLKGSDSLVNFLFQRGLGLPQCQNVINAAIGIGLLLKPEQIWLTGLDHSFHLGLEVDEHNQVWEKVTHFYSSKGEYFKHPLVNQKTGARVTLKEVFSNLWKVHESYDKLRMLSDRSQINIYNATQGGFVDAFERRPIK